MFDRELVQRSCQAISYRHLRTEYLAQRSLAETYRKNLGEGNLRRISCTGPSTERSCHGDLDLTEIITQGACNTYLGISSSRSLQPCLASLAGIVGLCFSFLSLSQQTLGTCCSFWQSLRSPQMTKVLWGFSTRQNRLPHIYMSGYSYFSPTCQVKASWF